MARFRLIFPPGNTELIRQRNRRFRREIALLLAFALTLGGILLVFTWVQSEILATNFRNYKLERRLQELENQEYSLRLEAASLSNAARIESRAREELGMERADLERIVFLKGGQEAPAVRPE
jgi:cell division protein FtsL